MAGVEDVAKPRGEEGGEGDSVRVCGMQFAYEGQPPLFLDFNLSVSPGSRCLLLGANGSGSFVVVTIASLVFFASSSIPFQSLVLWHHL